MNKQTVVMALAALLLTACSTIPQRQIETHATPAPIEARSPAHAAPLPGSGGYLPGDGPEANIPANLDAIPDAAPISEPPHRYANRPYVALGKSYTPMTVPGNFKQRGIASWYGKKFHGQRTSSGEKYDMYLMTAAHPVLPIPSFARVTNVATGKSVVVRINDRGPFMHDRAIDLSYTAAHKLGIIGNGSSEVEVESLVAYAGTYRAAQPTAVQSVPLEKAQSVAASKPDTSVSTMSTPVNSSAQAMASSNAYLQLGAFSTRQAAEQFLAEMRAKLGNIGNQLVLFKQNNKHRVHIGPYASQAEARNSRAGLRDKLGFLPVLSLH
ncbi:MAG: septal ring lytic transglycosylase RlpA family lipoprotein [Gallionellales bacterium CG03_land_8_20_14_0_80_55_15]|nr:MAG: septal ring lytic transglycosylase RlpA family lipoprotein [Gallionellales bacterium CG03_land_8_20_14_0_80_55_15]